MKQKSYLLLSVLILLMVCFTACGRSVEETVSETTEPTATETEAPKQLGLIDISTILKENQSVSYATMLKNNQLFLLINENTGEEKTDWILMLYDMKAEMVANSVYLQDEEKFYASVNYHILDNENILIYNEYEDTGIIYDKDLNTDGVILHDLYGKYPDFIYNYEDSESGDGSQNGDGSQSGDSTEPGDKNQNGDSSQPGDDDQNGDGSQPEDGSQNGDGTQPGEGVLDGEFSMPEIDELNSGEAGATGEDGTLDENAVPDYNPVMPFAVTENWTDYTDYAQFGYGEASTAVIFHDHPDLVCVGGIKTFNSIIAASGSCFLSYLDARETSTDSDAWEKPHSYGLTITNYEKGTRINEATTIDFPAYASLDLSASCMNETYVFLTFEDWEDTLTQYLYLWNYRTDEGSQPADDFKVYNSTTIDEANQTMIAEIKEKYDIHIITPYQQDEPLYNKMIYNMIEFNYEQDLNLGKVECYVMLAQLMEELSLFPEGIFKEIYEDYFDEYAIYLVQEIKDEGIGAFASNMWVENESPEDDYYGQVYVNFPAKTFAETHIPHEILHTMEYRLDVDCQNNWLELNPPSFNYEDDLYNNPELMDEIDFVVDDWFLSLYATRNDLEDRAVTFENLFMASFYKEAPYWLENEHIYEKINLLTQGIKASFPSVQKAEEVFWEKWLKD